MTPQEKLWKSAYRAELEARAPELLATDRKPGCQIDGAWKTYGRRAAARLTEEELCDHARAKARENSDF